MTLAQNKVIIFADMSSGSGSSGFSGEIGHEEHGGFIVGDSAMSPSTLRSIGEELGFFSDRDFLFHERPDFPRQEIPTRMRELLDRANFEPAHSRWQFVEAVGNFVVRKGDKLRGYKETLESAETQSGHAEAAFFGTASFEDQPVVLFGMNFDFLGGSVGEVVGQKFVAACDLACKKDLPIIALYASGGMRQHENAYAVAQMTTGIEALIPVLARNKLYMAFLFGPVFGGTSASTVIFADTVVGVAGGDSGFAGPNVIENFQKARIRDGSQSVEASYLERNIDLVVPYEDTYALIANQLRVLRPAKKVSKEDHVPTATQDEIWKLKHPSTPRLLRIGKAGLASPLISSQEKDAIATHEFPPPREPKETDDVLESLMDNYQRLATDVGRPDGDFLIRNIFDEVAPLYTNYRRGTRIVFPPIIGAFARIDNQPFLVVSNQPSFELRTRDATKADEAREDSEVFELDGKKIVFTGLKKILATPRPQDFQYFHRLMGIGKRLGLPAVTLTDNLGAEPTIAAEVRGQSEWIARSIMATRAYPHPIMSVITGALGSGGGLATTALAPRVMALRDAMVFVADPTAATSIVYRTPEPTYQQVSETLGGMDATAEVLHKLGFIKRLIENGNDPVETAHNIRQAIIEEHALLSSKSKAQLRRMGSNTIRDLRRGKIKKH